MQWYEPNKWICELTNLGRKWKLRTLSYPRCRQMPSPASGSCGGADAQTTLNGQIWLPSFHTSLDFPPLFPTAPNVLILRLQQNLDRLVRRVREPRKPRSVEIPSPGRTKSLGLILFQSSFTLVPKAAPRAANHRMIAGLENLSLLFHPIARQPQQQACTLQSEAFNDVLFYLILRTVHMSRKVSA
jgi:hypothetical protein